MTILTNEYVDNMSQHELIDRINSYRNEASHMEAERTDSTSDTRSNWLSLGALFVLNVLLVIGVGANATYAPALSWVLLVVLALVDAAASRHFTDTMIGTEGSVAE